MFTKQYFVYIATNRNNSVLYIGVTNNLVKRIFEHKSKFVKGFTSRYNIAKLVHYEVFENIEVAIKREKQLKGGSREKKLQLIKSKNSNFVDLYINLI